jgi:hypothetical protein
MPDNFAGVVVHPGENPDLIKTVDTTPAPDKPVTPKAPPGWDKMSYSAARAARKGK